MVIALLGLPGAGKTTLAKALAARLGGAAFLEPEEREWPWFVRAPHPLGDFTRLSWFRTQRVPLYYRAAHRRRRGEASVLDSYYDKWCVGWLGKPGLEWLIRPEDPYFGVALEIARVDAKNLPAADAVVVLEIDKQLWLNQLSQRGRAIDRSEAFAQSHSTQAYFVETALDRGRIDGTLVVRYTRRALSPDEEAREVLALLKTHGVVLT